MRKLLIFFISLISVTGWSQNTYNMSNTTVSDCDGFFLDSDAGFPSGDYDHNENLVFSICVPQATQIVMNFNSFCSEAFIDTIKFFDGPDVNSPLIFGPHSGNTLPPQIIATSGCLTIQFVSDANLACGGWNAEWYSVVPPPVPPEIIGLTASCTSDQINVQFDKNVTCDSLLSSNFTLTGANAPGISLGIGSLDCSAAPNDSTMDIIVFLDRTMDFCGTYILDFELNIADACDSVYNFIISDTFDILDCPIDATILATRDTLCIGECVDVSAELENNNCNRIYSWSNGWPSNPGPHTLCPTADSTVRLIVSDLNGNPEDTAFFTVYAFVVPDAGPDTSWCLNSGTFFPGNPDSLGGYWYGTGIIDSLTSEFDPSVSGLGQHYIYYSRVDCIDSLLVDIFNVYAGPDVAACPGLGPFQLTGSNPPGGYYLGLFTDSAGMFSPDSVGSFEVTYHLNGCVDTLVVDVDTIIFQAPISGPDTVCESQTRIQYMATPSGGTYSGPGLVDPNNGIFDASAMGPGDHTLFYDIIGCRDSLILHVLQIDAGNDIVACPMQPPFTLAPGSPAGGTWSGNGITDPNLGSYDPSWTVSNTNDTVIYAANGCEDTIIVRLRQTDVGIDSLEMCLNDEVLRLDFANTQRTPGGGTWTGTGVTTPNGPGTFDPGVAGVGNHWITYTRNVCSDSLLIEVSALPSINPVAAVCEYDPPFILTANQSGGIWSGLGITDSLAGTFDPSISGDGSHKVYYGFGSRCLDSVQVQVDAVPVINTSALSPTYCWRNGNQNLGLLPIGGSLTGPGATGSNQFNSSQAGVGTHTLMYVAQNGTCYDTAVFQLEVLPELSVQTNILRDTLCFGDSVNISALAADGTGGPYTYTWDQGLGAGASHWVKPTSTMIYTVTADDNCSDSTTQSIEVFVYPEIQTTITQSDTVCYASEGMVTINGSGNFSYLWNSTPPSSGSTLTAPPGEYIVQITDNVSGCTSSDTTEIPGHPYINAAFSKLPNRPCILISDGPLSVLDFSAGATSGYWDFGDGTREPYINGVQPSHFYSDTGIYIISLYIQNDGGCNSRFTETICVEAEPIIALPNAFSPNQDGYNDKFIFKKAGITNVELVIFDRWGEQISFDRNEPIEWDGTYMNTGQRVPQGVYAYVIRYTDLLDSEEFVLRGVIHVVR